MKLYDPIIKEVLAALPEGETKQYPYDTKRIWKDSGESELILKRDAAFELGGNGLPSVNFTAVTTSGMIKTDEVFLVGPDLDEIGADVPFARIVLLETEDLGEETDREKAFAAVRNLNFVRYHVFPKGYMVRVSPEGNQEQVRVSRKVIRAGIRFPYVGASYIRKYREVPEVLHARVIFVTDPAVVPRLVPYAAKVDDITKTLTHILDGLPTDCGHCAMKPVCDEVEGMRELHLKGMKK